jgi:hypothetical protein
MPTTFLFDTLKDEIRMLERHERECAKKMNALPHGSYFERQVRGGRYGYVNVREGNRVKQNYLGKVSEPFVQGFREGVEKRRELGEELKALRDQRKVLERALKGIKV